MAKSTIDIIYQNDELLVVNKPAGVLSIPDRHDAQRPNLKAQLTHLLQQPALTVHRLDADTSGVMVFARTPDAQRQLSEQFAQRQIEKTYYALVEGVPEPAAGKIDRPIAPVTSKPGRMQVHSKGKPAQTSYGMMERFRNFSWLTVQIATGRTHQIRVHLQSIGHPLVADPFYGRRKALFLSDIKGKQFRLGKGATERPLLARTALHAASLSFAHPSFAVDTPVRFEAPLPKDLRASLQQLRKWG